MSDSVLTISADAHLAAFSRMAMTSKKTLPQLWREEARICFGGTGTMPGVAGITPPYGEGGLQSARTAESKAKAKIAADIHALYGTPGEAYDLLPSHNGQADAFWFMYQHDDIAGANQLLREATGSILYPFDDGAFHRKNFRRRRRGGSGFKFYVSNPEELELYIKFEQEQIWWLTSGWMEPLTALGAKLPTGVKRHSEAPGNLNVIINDAEISIAVRNDVSYAGSIKDMSRRIKMVMNEWRVARLDRMWANYQEKIAKAAGFKQS